MVPTFKWINFYFMSCIHLIPIFFINDAKYLKHAKFLIIFVALKLLSVTAGFHRLWTHKSYSANILIKLIFFVICSSSGQSSIQEWTSAHRMHHRYEESNPELDSYSIKGGFFWAHMGWTMFHKTNDYNKIKDEVIEELKSERKPFDNSLIEFENKYYAPLFLLNGLIVPTLILSKIHPEDSIWCCLLTVILSLVFSYHITWLINSGAHSFGDRPYSTQHSSRNNHILSFFTMGEGYHNYHHSYPKDYRASENLFCANLTGWFINLLSKLGLASKLVTAEKMSPTDMPELKKVVYNTS